MEIPEITQKQLNVMNDLAMQIALGNVPLCSVTEHNETDSPEVRAKLIDRLEMFEHLVSLDLLKEVSGEEAIAKIVEKLKQETNRVAHVYMLTSTGIMMFSAVSDAPIEENKEKEKERIN